MSDTESFRREELKRHTDLILNALGEGVYGLDLEGRATFANPAAAKMTGWEIDELIGKPQHEVIHHSKADGSPYPDTACPIYAAFRNAATYRVADEVFWQRGGASFPVEYCSTPMRDEHGEVVGAVVVFRDVTERKRLERQLRESEERFRRLYRQSPAMLHSIDENGMMVDVSDHWLEVLGYSREEVMGQESIRFLTEESRTYAVNEALPEFWRTGSARDVPYQFVTKGGKALDVLLSAIRERDKAGNSVKTLAVLVDVTAQKQAEQELRFTNFALDRIGSAAFWMDADGKFVYVNEAACRLVKYTREELLSMYVSDLNPDYPTDVWPDTWKAIKERGSYTFEARFRSKDGSIFPADITVNYLKSGGGEYNCSFVRDITERKEAEEERQRARDELEGKVERQMLRKNPYGLTFRELTVLHHVAAGKTDKEIAAELGISPLTAQNHVASILRKMDASSRTAAGVRAVRDGLVE